MSDNSSEETNNSQNDLESSQENQKKVGDAESNPETSGPTDKVREEAFEDTDTEEKSNEPA
ncbi:hypothetical protein [Candidatus Nitrosocosmicus hydrocola]|uniref:hypothetical protein n=1 Tax=Candidatus Nitrosocosmicus hydrocola TaxID=1826872 RepID=UPI0011E5ED76|nr:hypothetical protein [Candidatus Nitrosocosmicus hydrocola]